MTEQVTTGLTATPDTVSVILSTRETVTLCRPTRALICQAVKAFRLHDGVPPQTVARLCLLSACHRSPMLHPFTESWYLIRWRERRGDFQKIDQRFAEAYQAVEEALCDQVYQSAIEKMGQPQKEVV